MSVRKRIGNVCLICGDLIATSGHVQHECLPSAERVKLCATVAVLPDANETPGPVVRAFKVVTNVSSWIGAQNFRWG